MENGQDNMIKGQVEAIYFENPTTLYKVLRIKISESDTALADGLTETIVTGQFALIHYDTTYEFVGHFIQHPKYGQQFVVNRYQQVMPTSEAGLIDYFASERFKGIGPKLAQKIVATLGLDAIELIINDANVLKQVNSLTADKRRYLHQQLLVHQGTERIIMQLAQWGFGPKLSDKIYQTFKSETLDRIQANPYILVQEVEGIGFAKADSLAAQLEIEPQAIIRIEAALVTALNMIANEQGDTYALYERMAKVAGELLERSRPVLIDQELIEQALDSALLNKRIIQLDKGYMLPSLYYAELGIAQKMQQYMAQEQFITIDPELLDAKIKATMQVTGVHYDAQQVAALKLAMNSPISIITGGPGTGKTTLIRGLITLHSLVHEYELADHYTSYDLPPVLLAAPTGRAAKRMTDMSGLPASTIHRLIGFNRDSLVEEFHADQLEGELLIVDECSMIDTWLMNWLWQAIPPTMQVVFVGDKDQLPSVGPGKVFDDMIASQVIPTIYLERIYRQQDQSTIIDLAHAIRKGQLPADLLDKQVDRSFIQCSTQQAVSVVERVVALAQQKGYHAYNMQILAPMYKGQAGIDSLNQQLQAILNPLQAHQAAITYFKQTFRVGDKVLQLVNNPDEQVFNGDIGRIEAVYPSANGTAKDEMIVSFDGRELIYTRSEFDQLTLAYCCSIHKAQGSEYDLVILPLVGAYQRMLRRDLLYTAVTRAKQRIVLIGELASFQQAIQQQENKRATNLKDLMLTALKGSPTRQPALTRSSNENEYQNHNEHEDDKEKDVQQVCLGEHISKRATYQLTMANYLDIDPMIGMGDIQPSDFIPAS